MAVSLVGCAGCLVTTTEGTPLAQGELFSCRYQLHDEDLIGEQCGPIGDEAWVVHHFNVELPPGTAVFCRAIASPCVYDPDGDPND